jgi:hypothetical protein
MSRVVQTDAIVTTVDFPFDKYVCDLKVKNESYNNVRKELNL